MSGGIFGFGDVPMGRSHVVRMGLRGRPLDRKQGLAWRGITRMPLIPYWVVVLVLVLWRGLEDFKDFVPCRTSEGIYRFYS